MIGKFILSTAIASSLWCSSSNQNKFLVVDSETYNKIEKLNILNGGIQTKYVIKSKLLNDSTLGDLYPEIFAYNGKECYDIQNVYMYKEKNKYLNTKKEIEKLKILNLLHNSENTSNIDAELSMKTIQAIGIICGNKLHIRNKDYNIGENISKYYIKSIDEKLSNVILGVK